MKKILGLDLGTNSIGWALVEIDHEKSIVKVIGLGSRIIPMNAAEISDFENKGIIKSAAAQRTEKRGPRRLNERFILRRDRLHLVLNLLEALPEHYKIEIDFERNGQKSGRFKQGKEPKIAYKQKKENPKKYDFVFKKAYNEMLNDLGIENIKGQRLPYDWTLYYLRKKALDGKKLSLEELAWVLLSYNQKRGYEKTEVIDKSTKENEIVEEFDLKVKNVSEQKQDENGKNYYEIYLEGNDNFVYKEYSDKKMTDKGDLKEVIKITKLDDEGNEKEITFKIIDIYSLTIQNVEYNKDDGKHNFIISFDNGWKEIKNPKNYTFKYKNTIEKKYDYIVETSYYENGELKLEKKKERKLREPDFSDNSNDWTLLKKKTEKAALKYNIRHKYIEESGKVKKFISPKIYDILKKDAQNGTRTKIIGGMFQVVDRKFYREELNTIIKNKKKYHTELEDKQLLNQCIKLLYPNNKKRRKVLENKKTIEYLLTEDILLYQRPLKSKKSEIGNCKYESRSWTDKETGEIKIEPLKVASASHPLFQEFRIWDKIHNLKIIEKEQKTEKGVNTNIDVTSQYLKSQDDYKKLFNFFNNLKSVNQKQFLDFCKKEFKLPYKNKEANFVWNFPEDEELKGNETRTSFITRFKRCGFNYNNFLTQEKEIDLWHYLYSVNYKERQENNNKSLRTFFTKYFAGYALQNETLERLINDFENYPKFDSRYCAYSEKALKKLLPFLRMGNNVFTGQFDLSEFERDLQNIEYNKNNIDKYVENLSFEGNNKKIKKLKEEKKQNLHEALWKHSINERIKEILNRLNKINFEAEEIDFSQVVTNENLDNSLPFPKGLFNAFKSFKTIEDFTNLDLTKASYLVYGRHSELAKAKFWNSPEQITRELHNELKHNSLNNPIAEKVLLEMMQVVAEIWKTYGEKDNKGNYKKLFDKIHIEVGRELKKTAKEKEKITKSQGENRKQNRRLRQILQEFLSSAEYKANPQNPDHFERLKIVEDSASIRKNTDKDFFKGKSYSKKDIDDILKKETISKQDFDKYKLWIEQGYRSPYTNQIIKLSDLFDGNKYNIDHIFPQALISNDSLSNKVVCETEVNKDKSNKTGRAYIISAKGKEFKDAQGNLKFKIVSDDTYVSIVKSQFFGQKREILLAKEIPDKFINSQLNTSRHIARKAMELLSHVVREEGEIEYRSKNVLPVTGAITSKLKKAWKLDHVWKELVSPRFIRMNELTKSNLFGNWREVKDEYGNVKRYFDCKIDDAILEKMSDYDIKRIDHRHHALDALIVALCTEDHVNYLNNINANVRKEDFGKQKQLEKQRLTLKKKIKFSVANPTKDNPNHKDWYFMLPGEQRKNDAGENSSRDTVVEMNYQYKEDYFARNYKTMILSALQNTVVTFKQNKRVINKTVNKYQKWDNEKNRIVIYEQEPKTLKEVKNSKNKYNWAVRRSLGKETFYGRVNLKRIEEKSLISSIENIYKDYTIVVDKKLKNEIKNLISLSSDIEDFKKRIKLNYPKDKKIELYYFTDNTTDKKKIASREELSKNFKTSRIDNITDTGIQKILKRHLEQFDTIELPFQEAIQYYDALLEKDEFDAIINDKENNFNNKEDFITYLKNNEFKFKKTDYSKLNVFVEKVKIENLREREDNEKNIKITEHPEIAFTPEEIEKMNEPENIKRLNNGKNHKPIKKVRVSSGFGNQRQVSTDLDAKHPVKLKQYVVNDAGSNLYFGIYEREYLKDGKLIKERKFQDIGLTELIETLKQDSSKRKNPLPDKIYDNEGNEYIWKFTLSPLDLVYVPTQEEIDNPSLVDVDNLSYEQMQRIYKYVDGGKGQNGYYAKFIPYNVSFPIWKFHQDKTKKDIYKTLKAKNSITISEKELLKNEYGLGSQESKNQKSLDNIMIKDHCIKLKVNRLGEIEDVIS